MSTTHLLHCPKHRKPLPCAHCALVVAVSAPAVRPPILENINDIRNSIFGPTAVVTQQARPKKPEPVPPYRELIGLSHDALLGLFDKPIYVPGYKNVTTPKDKLEDKSELEKAAEALKERIKEVEALAKTRMVHWWKIHRPDEPRPDKNAFAVLKREDAAEIKKLKGELGEIREKLKNWDVREYSTRKIFTEIEIAFGEKFCITHREVEEEHGYFTVAVKNRGGDIAHVEMVGSVENPIGPEYTIDEYRKLLSLELGIGGTSEGWRCWENRVILQAIASGLVKPPADIVERYPALGGWMDRSVEDPDHELEENQLRMTGGASMGVGITIYSRGWRQNKHGRQLRQLESFDSTGQARGGTKGSADDCGGSDSYERFFSDDLESYDPR